MGYTTEFRGEFDITPALEPAQIEELKKFSEERHDALGESGVWELAPEMPGVWCEWEPDENGNHLRWNEAEKFYNYVDWLTYLVDHFLAPWGRKLNGDVAWAGEGSGDSGIIYALNNRIDAVADSHSNRGPYWRDNPMTQGPENPGPSWLNEPATIARRILEIEAGRHYNDEAYGEMGDSSDSDAVMRLAARLAELTLAKEKEEKPAEKPDGYLEGVGPAPKFSQGEYVDDQDDFDD